MKSFSLKKSMLMLVALFMLGACSASPDVTPDDYNTEFIKNIKKVTSFGIYTVGSSGAVLKRNDDILLHFKNATSDTSAIYCRHRGEVGLIYEITVSYNNQSWSASDETSNLTEELFLNIVGGYGSLHHTVVSGDYKFLSDGKTLYYYSDNNPDYEPLAYALEFKLVDITGYIATATYTAKYDNSPIKTLTVTVTADQDSKKDAIKLTK